MFDILFTIALACIILYCLAGTVYFVQKVENIAKKENGNGSKWL